MLAFITYVPVQLLHGLAAFGRWVRRHPRWASFLFIATVLYITGWAVGSAAYADPLGTSIPSQLGDDLADQHGVRASHYEALFISNGDILHPNVMYVSGMLQMWWSIVFNCIVTCIEIIKWVVGFQWVSAIAVPAEGISKIVTTFLTQFQLTSFAIFLCGLVAGFYVLRNKWPAAVVEVGMTIALSVLAAGLFANPIAWITSPNGPLDQAKAFGAETAVALSGNGYLKDNGSSTDIVGEAITAPLVQTFVVDPIQVVSFGHLLTGNCAKTFYSIVATDDTQTTGDNNVLNAVAQCDTSAGTTANNPAEGMLPTILSVGSASTGLFGFGLTLAALTMGAVIVLLWDGFRLMIATIAGMFPFSDRSKFWKSLFGVFAALVTIVLITGMLAAYLSFLCWAISGLVKLGMPLQALMGTITLFELIILVLLVWQIISIRRRAHKVGDLVHNKLEASKSLAPTMALPGLTSLAAARQLLPHKKPRPQESDGFGFNDNRTQMVNVFGGQRPVEGPNLSHVNATTPPRPPRPGGPSPALTSTRSPQQLASGATRVASGALRLGRAAAGGPQALALEAGKMTAATAARRTASRIVVDSSGRGTVQRGSTSKDAARTMSAATSDPGIVTRPATRRISIGPDGVGRVIPASRPTFVVPSSVGPRA